MTQGILTTNGVVLEKHEYITVLFFLKRGQDITLIPPSNTPNTQRADFWMDGPIWEVKSPTGNSPRMTIERIVHKAARQSENIIIDLRRTKLPDDQSIKCIESQFERSRRIRRILIITKSEKVVALKKK